MISSRLSSFFKSAPKRRGKPAVRLGESLDNYELRTLLSATAMLPAPAADVALADEAPAPEKTPDISGKWNFSFGDPISAVGGEVDITQSGNKFQVDLGEIGTINGKVKHNGNVKAKLKTAVEGNQVKFKFKGKLGEDGNTMSGFVRVKSKTALAEGIPTKFKTTFDATRVV